MTITASFGRTLLYLGQSDVQEVGLTSREVADRLETIYLARTAGKTFTKPKLGLPLGEGRMRFALMAAAGEPSYSSVKCSALTPDNYKRGLPHVNALVLLFDLITGVPVAVMDGNWITAIRTAGIGAIAAKRLARRDARILGFVGCGLQAHSNLVAFCEVFPIERVLANGVPVGTAEVFAEEVGRSGLGVEVLTDPRAVVERSDIVITSVSDSPGLKPFLEASWLKPGSFANLVDLGRSWLCDGLSELDCVATDDYEQSEHQVTAGRLPYCGRFDADLAELISGAHPGRTDSRQRTVLIHPGFGLGDLAVAAAIFDRAKAAGIGVELLR